MHENIDNNTELKDELGRKPFAEVISSIIANPKSTECAVIGIEGDWGEGKTYAIELIRRQLETLSPSLNKPVKWVSFDPWHIRDHEHIAEIFLKKLALDLTKTTGGLISKLKSFSKPLSLFLARSYNRSLVLFLVICLFYIVSYFLHEYAGYLSLTVILVLEFLFNKGDRLLHSLSEALGDYAKLVENSEKKTLSELKLAVAEKLRSEELPFSRIVIAIEDLDRLTPAEIRSMAQLIRMIADFPNVTYLLAYDREQVIRALGEFSGSKSTADEAERYGEGYLQKIVHSAYKLPLPPEGAIADTIYNRFYKRTKAIYGSAPFQKNYWLQIKNIMSDFWPTLRHGERVINRATQISTMLKDKSNPADVLVAAYLMEYQPRLWDWLWFYRGDILSSTAYNFKEPSESLSFPLGQNHKPSGISAIANSSIIPIESLDTLLSEVFHNSYSRPMGDYHLGSESSMEHYYRYEQSMSTDAIELARKVAAAGAKNFKRLLKKAKRTDDYAYSFFQALSRELPQDVDWNSFSLPLLNELGVVFENVPRHELNTLPAERVFQLAEKIINCLPKERCSQAVLELQRKWIDSGLTFLATRLVGSIAVANRWIPLNKDNPSKIDLPAPEEIRIGLIKNLQTHLKSLSSDREAGKKLLAHHMAPYILFKWKLFSPDDASTYIASCLEDDYLVFMLINSFVKTRYSSDEPYVEKIISPEDLYEITDKQPHEILALLEGGTLRNSYAAANYPELLSIVRRAVEESEPD